MLNQIKPLKFQCSKCGACCKRIGKTGLMPDRGDGACIHLGDDNLCKIYDTRPELCNMEKMWTKRNYELDLESRGVSKKDYFRFNSNVCNNYMDQDGISKEFKIDLSIYDGMEEQKNPEEKVEEKKFVKSEYLKKTPIRCQHCNDNLIATTIIEHNGQVNLMCANLECIGTGFVLNQEVYYSFPPEPENKSTENTD